MELIDKKPLIRHLVDWQMEQFAEVGHERELNLLDLIIKGIENEPTVEAKEVVHGKWIYNEYYTWECGNCGFHPFKGFIPKEPGFNYCPNCGCDMRTSAE